MRDHYEYKESMFTNSLFLDFLRENQLNECDGATRDIICLEFNYGSRSFDDQMDHLRTVGRNSRLEYKLAKSGGSPVEITKKLNKRKKIAELYMVACANKAVYHKMSKEEIREMYYCDGCTVQYKIHSKNHLIRTESIHYRMLYRSAGKAKKGSCMFIRDELYEKSRDFLYMGIQMPEHNAPIVEISAYASLVSSGIVNEIKINPRNILVLKEVERSFETNIIEIRTDANRHCTAERVDGYMVKNALFDGQALIDSSIFPTWGNGYILLRHHFCKMASFCTNIQDFFKDYFGNNYSSATVTDMFGVVHKAKDIELITTENAMKWLKFDGITYDDWCKRVEANGCMFGIVKTAHESKFGDVQRMSYQMVNSLDMPIMENVVRESVNYVESMKSDNEVFFDFLRRNQNFSNDYEVLLALCDQNPDFVRSSYFRQRKRRIISAYVLNLKTGKILQNAENLTLVGSPYAMLLYAASGDPNAVDKDTTFKQEKDAIQCFTERFADGVYLAGFRSPFNSRNNLTYMHNVYDNRMFKYFCFGKQIVAANMIGTDFQDRNNGSDFDGDFVYVTAQPDIVEHARRCYQDYPTIVNNIPKEKNIYDNNMVSYATMDNNLAKSQLDIGESSNLAQVAQTYAYNFGDEKYDKYACILAVLAQVSVDSAKRRFDVDVGREIKYIKNDMNIVEYGYPSFWELIRPGFNKDRINPRLRCPMNFLYGLDLSDYRSDESTLPMSNFFISYKNGDRRKSRRVEEMIEKYQLKVYTTQDSEEDNTQLLLRRDFDYLIEDIRRATPSSNYLGMYSWLLDRAFRITPSVNRNNAKIQSKINKNRSLLIRVLYTVNKRAFLKCFSRH